MRNLLQAFYRDQEGQDLVEYSLLLALVGLAAVVILTGLGQSINSLFSTIRSKIDAAAGALS